MGKRASINASLALYAAVSILIYRIPLVSLLFLVPLQVAKNRLGFRDFVIALCAVFLANAGWDAWLLWNAYGENLRFFSVALNTFVLASAAGGFLFLNGPKPEHLRRLYRLLAVTFVFSALSLLWLLWRSAGGSMLTVLARTAVSNAESTLAGLSSLFVSGSDATALLGDTEVMVGILTQTGTACFAALYFLVLGLSAWLGDVLSFRLYLRMWKDRPADFRVPGFMVWPLMVCLLALCADLLFGIGIAISVAVNALLILFFLYSFHGALLVRYLVFERLRSTGIRAIVIVMMFICSMLPGLNLVILAGLPGMAVSENWIRYRVPKKEEGDQDESDFE